jgi:hypothetical protein
MSPSVHRALFLASLAATAACFAVPAAMAVIVALGSGSAGLALGFTGMVALGLGPWVLLGAYLGALLVALGMRASGLPLVGQSLRRCQLVGLGMAAGLTGLGGLLTNEVEVTWLLFTMPAGIVGGSVFHRSSRVAPANDACC